MTSLLLFEMFAMVSTLVGLSMNRATLPKVCWCFILLALLMTHVSRATLAMGKKLFYSETFDCVAVFIESHLVCLLFTGYCRYIMTFRL